jgi:hypothetical protein
VYLHRVGYPAHCEAIVEGFKGITGHFNIERVLLCSIISLTLH